jgi:hypothetical protein
VLISFSTEGKSSCFQKVATTSCSGLILLMSLQRQQTISSVRTPRSNQKRETEKDARLNTHSYTSKTHHHIKLKRVRRKPRLQMMYAIDERRLMDGSHFRFPIASASESPLAIAACSSSITSTASMRHEPPANSTRPTCDTHKVANVLRTNVHNQVPLSLLQNMKPYLPSQNLLIL